MKKNHFSLVLSFLLCLALIAAATFTTLSAAEAIPAEVKPEANDSVETVAEVVEIGEGEYSFLFDVQYLDGNVESFLIFTDETNVGAALTALELIAGDQGPYGLYVKTVNGITLDYNTDGHYWAFYENDEYAMAGVDQTELKPDIRYAMKAE